jgi:hypothetical protein
MAADDIAKGASQLIRWGKKIIPATADDIERFGPNAARVKALMRVIQHTSGDAVELAHKAMYKKIPNLPSLDEASDIADEAASFSGRARASKGAKAAADINAILEQDAKKRSGILLSNPAMFAARGEVVSDIIAPDTYKSLVNPLAIAKRFDMSVPNAPEGFTNAARTLGERGLVSGPKDIELARRISMLPPHLQDVYFSLLQDGSDPMAMLAALKLLG